MNRNEAGSSGMADQCGDRKKADGFLFLIDGEHQDVPLHEYVDRFEAAHMVDGFYVAACSVRVERLPYL
jgi:hypothetical protein